MNDNLSGKCEIEGVFCCELCENIIFAGVINDFRYG